MSPVPKSAAGLRVRRCLARQKKGTDFSISLISYLPTRNGSRALRSCERQRTLSKESTGHWTPKPSALRSATKRSTPTVQRGWPADSGLPRGDGLLPGWSPDYGATWTSRAGPRTLWTHSRRSVVTGQRLTDDHLTGQ